MQVTDEHLRQYQEEGFCLVKGLIPVEPIDAARRRVFEIVEQIPDWPTRHFQVLDPARYRSARGEALPGSLQKPAEREEVFRGVAAHPNLMAAMESLLGGPVELFADQIGIKHGMIREAQGGEAIFTRILSTGISTHSWDATAGFPCQRLAEMQSPWRSCRAVIWVGR